jgi:hypothetical protein
MQRFIRFYMAFVGISGSTDQLCANTINIFPQQGLGQPRWSGNFRLRQRSELCWVADVDLVR